MIQADIHHISEKIHLIGDNFTSISDDITSISDNITSNSEKIHRVADHLADATNCTDINWDYTCCTSANPCGLDQGDCDSDDECSGDLKCGDNNCIGFGASDADCCILVGIHDNAINIASNSDKIHHVKVFHP